MTAYTHSRTASTEPTSTAVSSIYNLDIKFECDARNTPQWPVLTGHWLEKMAKAVAKFPATNDSSHLHFYVSNLNYYARELWLEALEFEEASSTTESFLFWIQKYFLDSCDLYMPAFQAGAAQETNGILDTSPENRSFVSGNSQNTVAKQSDLGLTAISRDQPTSSTVQSKPTREVGVTHEKSDPCEVREMRKGTRAAGKDTISEFLDGEIRKRIASLQEYAECCSLTEKKKLLDALNEFIKNNIIKEGFRKKQKQKQLRPRKRFKHNV